MRSLVYCRETEQIFLNACLRAQSARSISGLAIGPEHHVSSINVLNELRFRFTEQLLNRRPYRLASAALLCFFASPVFFFLLLLILILHQESRNYITDWSAV